MFGHHAALQSLVRQGESVQACGSHRHRPARVINVMASTGSGLPRTGAKWLSASGITHSRSSPVKPFRQGDVEVEFIEHVGVAPAQQELLLRGPSVRPPSAVQLGFTGRRAEVIQTAARNRPPDHQGRAGRSGSTAQESHRSSCQSQVAGARKLSCWMQDALTAASNADDVHVLLQPEGRLQSAVKAIAPWSCVSQLARRASGCAAALQLNASRPSHREPRRCSSLAGSGVK